MSGDEAIPDGCATGADSRAVKHPMTISSYAVIVEGLLTAEHWRTWFEGMTLSTVGEGATRLVGDFDQPALHGLFAKIRDLGLVLVAVQRLPSWDDARTGKAS